MNLAVFDLDHTLLPVDCESGWVEYMLTAGGVKGIDDLYAIRDQLYRDYDAGRLDYDAFGAFQMRILAMFRRADLDRWVEDYTRRYIAPIMTQAAKDLVEAHRKAGDTLLLCTAAYDYLAHPIAGLFGIEHVLGAEAETDAAGEFTGRMMGPHNFSTNKPIRLKAFIDGIQSGDSMLGRLSFYSDSASDMPMFEFTEAHRGTCVAVNASPALARIASERGWKSMTLYTPEDTQHAEALRLGVLKALQRN